MLFERIESEGLAHYSYLIGDSGEAIVIDPRRDCQIYIDKATRNGFNIRHILETHRNEDYVIGSTELADRSNADIWHADSQLDYQYGKAVEDGQKWKVGRLELEAIHTPGHTPGSMSYLLRDQNGEDWIIFTGDVLFAGDVGRVDLMGMDRAEEMAEHLYESIFEKIIPLGDDLIVCPAHGAGSVCGASIAERLWTTVGLEKRTNPKLQYDDKSGFIEKVAKKIERPPYFRMMEKLNVEGPPILGNLPNPEPLTPKEFSNKAESSVVVDTRMELGFSAAHVPDAISIWADGLPNFAGWFLPYDKLILLNNKTNDPTKVVKYLIRLGYDSLDGYLSGGMLSWHRRGYKSESIETVDVHNFCKLLDKKKESPWILDVRSREEVIENKIPKATHIHVTQLKENLEKIPKDEKIYIFCGSGLRSMIAASLLKREGWKDPAVILGGTDGWNSVTCPIE